MRRTMKAGVLAAAMAASTAHAAEPRPSARDLGIAPGVFGPGPNNAITDVAGVKVGQVSRIEGDDVRTGVFGCAETGMTTVRV